MRPTRRSPMPPTLAPRLTGLAVVAVVAVAAARPAQAQGRPAEASAAEAGAAPAKAGAPGFTLLAAGGYSGHGFDWQLVGRYDFWATPSWGVAPEAFTGVLQTSLDVTGADVAAAWRRPGPSADLVLHAGVGAATYRLIPSGPLFANAGSLDLPTEYGATATAEASLVLHLSPAFGMVVGARGGLLTLGSGVAPAFSGELVLGFAQTH